jgi:hypothetical protein
MAHGIFDRDDHELLEATRRDINVIKLELAALFTEFYDLSQFLRTKIHLTSGKVTLMPANVTVGQTFASTLVGTWSDGQTRPLDATYRVQYVQSAPGDATEGPVAADGSAVFTSVAAGTDSISANVTRPDGTVIQFTPDVLTIEAPPVVLVGGAVVLQ